VSCKGAFGSATDNWLAGYSWLACSGNMAGRTCTAIPPSPFATLASNTTMLGGTLSTSTGLVSSTSYLMATQLFVPSGVTLTIAPGTSIFALPVPTGVAAPALVVVKGGALVASSTEKNGINITSVVAG